MALILLELDLPPWAREINDLINRIDDEGDRRRRPVEYRALGNIERHARALNWAGKRLELAPIYWRILKLERAAMRFFSNLSHDERIEFIVVNLEQERLKKFARRTLTGQVLMPMAYTAFEIEGYLERIDDVLMVRERLGIPMQIDDFTQAQAIVLYRKYMAAPRAGLRRLAA